MRVRFYLGSLLAVFISFWYAIIAHELTHEVQRLWRGQGLGRMYLNPLGLKDMCGGKFACVEMPMDGLHGDSFWDGEGIAYVVTYVTFILVFWWFLPRLAGIAKRPRKKAARPTDATILAAMRPAGGAP